MYNTYIKFTQNQLNFFGAHITVSKKYITPNLKLYLIGFKLNSFIFNLDFINIILKKLCFIIINLSKLRQNILIINESKHLKLSKKNLDKNLIFIDHYWKGGILTNFKQMKNNKKVKQNFNLKSIFFLPSLVIILKTRLNSWPINESKKLNIPLAAVNNIKQDFKDIPYLLPNGSNSNNLLYFYSILISNFMLEGLKNEKLKLINIY